MHAGGLRYHGDAPMVCGLVRAGAIEARAYRQNETFEAAVQFARTEGIIPAPEPAHAIRAVIEEADAAQRGRRGAHDPVRALRARPLRPRRLRRLPRRATLEDPEFSEAEMQAALDGLPEAPAIA